MIKPNYMEKLLDGIEVEWRPLGEVLVRTKGTNITAGQMKELHKNNGKLKIFAGGKTFAFVDFEDIPEKDINRETSIIVKSRGIIEFEYYDKPFTHKNEMWSYHSKNENINIKFAYYFLKINEPYFQNVGSRMQMPQIATPDTDKFKIPIPPLKVQEEIVRILDTFTELTAELAAELTAELTARKKQYTYYRDKLLTFGEEVEWNSLEDITIKAYSGATPLANSTEYYNNGSIPWLRTQEVRFVDIYETDIKITDIALKRTAVKWVPENCVIIAISGATAGRSAINKIPLTTNQHCLCLEINAKIANYRYVFHWVSSQYESLKNLGRGARGDLNAVIIKSLKVPIPSLTKQEHIVSILDKFDALTSSITEGLPRELELRKKQYDYYRNLLLSFPKSEVGV